LPYRLWDESFLAMHTYEMLHNGNYLVTYSFGIPEMLNTKPPFVIWCMLASCKLLGYNILAIRLPNAIAAAVLCFSLFFILLRYTRLYLFSFLTVAILVCCAGYIHIHVTRTGEYDSFLTLFLALYGLSIFLLTQTENPAYQKWLYVLFASTVSLAILTKGIAALMFAPGLLLYLFLEKKFLRVVFCREFLGSVLFIVSIGAGYYLLREIYNPGYLQAVFDNELGGRFLKVNDGHNGPFWKYFYEILNDEFTYWMPFLFMGIVAIFSEKLLPFKKVRKLGVFSLVVSLSHLLVLSTSATKLFWYAAPEFPFYAIIAALGLFSIIFHLTKFLPSKYSSGIVTIFLVLLFYKPYTETLSYVLNERDERWNEDFYSVGNFLVDNKAKNLDGYKIIYNGDLVRPYLCHIYELKTKGQTLKMCKAKDLKIGDVALIQTDSDRVNIKQHFNFNEINKNGNFSAWKMIEQKP
jgi:4-amino-4-deoxy-L-arabinose transferase-like glycosyltransferase